MRTLTAFCMRPAEMTMAVRLVVRGGIFFGEGGDLGRERGWRRRMVGWWFGGWRRTGLF